MRAAADPVVPSKADLIDPSAYHDTRAPGTCEDTRDEPLANPPPPMTRRKPPASEEEIPRKLRSAADRRSANPDGPKPSGRSGSGRPNPRPRTRRIPITRIGPASQAAQPPRTHEAGEVPQEHRPCTRKRELMVRRSRRRASPTAPGENALAQAGRRGLRRHRPRTRARYQIGGATPEASPTDLIAKRCSARTRSGHEASRQASGVGLTCEKLGRRGSITRPSGSSSPVSSKTTTPLQSRLQPCSGW